MNLRTFACVREDACHEIMGCAYEVCHAKDGGQMYIDGQKQKLMIESIFLPVNAIRVTPIKVTVDTLPLCLKSPY